jgi:hypothetical protein
MELTLQNLQFLELAMRDKILPSLKTYADTLLFYYLGHLALENTEGLLSEIGVGGSTYALRELSEKKQRTLYVIDKDQCRVDDFVLEQRFFKNAKIQNLVIDSLTLRNLNLSNMSYVHLDGDKNYEICHSDLDWAMTSLAPMGMICQDDYGNNKWPTITSITHELMIKKDFSFLMIGDSSAWLVRSEDRIRWLKILQEDREFNALIPYLNVASSKSIDHRPIYYFMNYFKTQDLKNTKISKEMIYYYKNLDRFNTADYLQMPYKIQSEVGRALPNFNTWLDFLK